ncbi:hypothetical protein [Pseudoalteromonas luteoviolacea]|uniref:Uncharacterized protein n=1 Tax=Pseudoalteromonas luteoviolacea (strain 2ta16) TaxID=1353533 RepID=V4H879_PSEL2|nr:hypothetical protein [Pseudoalteromonas luteoviolacea]ESP93691.1 hypothetical protein PL2TA16_02895 [Pseudoalteromonas luteoviolacea 2ta16]KZN41191.1 hypothetical protein N483_16400 [Pseudoalteromonas luteoviolacea NCIMB 1944]
MFKSMKNNKLTTSAQNSEIKQSKSSVGFGTAPRFQKGFVTKTGLQGKILGSEGKDKQKAHTKKHEKAKSKFRTNNQFESTVNNIYGFIKEHDLESLMAKSNIAYLKRISDSSDRWQEYYNKNTHSEAEKLEALKHIEQELSKPHPVINEDDRKKIAQGSLNLSNYLKRGLQQVDTIWKSLKTDKEKEDYVRQSLDSRELAYGRVVMQVSVNPSTLDPEIRSILLKQHSTLPETAKMQATLDMDHFARYIVNKEGPAEEVMKSYSRENNIKIQDLAVNKKQYREQLELNFAFFDEVKFNKLWG